MHTEHPSEDSSDDTHDDTSGASDTIATRDTSDDTQAAGVFSRASALAMVEALLSRVGNSPENAAAMIAIALRLQKVPPGLPDMIREAMAALRSDVPIVAALTVGARTMHFTLDTSTALPSDGAPALPSP